MHSSRSCRNVRGNTTRDLFACTGRDPAELLASASAIPDDPAFRSLMDTVSASLVACEGKEHILTDDKAPVEVLGMRMIDSLIADEVSYYKTIYERAGLQGLLEDFGVN